MDPAAAKQQVIDRVKQATNILVTVSNNPSVDQLAACIGLTLLLNKMDKHATAVFSGAVPSTIEFLQPDKTIEANTDSLRDFIISLDKNKADKLRYKVEDQVVKIFITPYKTSLSQNDLVFSQGDFNVEVVMALGVHDRTQIDAAITAHGRILHDATVISLNAGQGKAPQVGQINWQEASASSLSEMLVNISEAFGPGLIDGQMATAFLTGVVSETNRFSNAKTSPKVMTIAAQLMAAGANQQLIVSKLEPPNKPKEVSVRPAAVKQPPARPTGPKPLPAETLEDGTLHVSHEAAKKDNLEVSSEPGEIQIDEQGNLINNQLQAAVPSVTPAPEQTLPTPEPPPKREKIIEPPTLSAPAPAVTPEPPPPGPHTLLDPKTYQPSIDAPFSATSEPEWQNPYDAVAMDPLNGQASQDQELFKHNNPISPPEQSFPAKPQSAPTEADLSQIRTQVANAIDSQPFNPSGHPLEAFQSQPLPATPAIAAPTPVVSAEPSLPLPGVNTAPTPTTPVVTDSVAPPAVPPPLQLPATPPIPTNPNPS